MTIKNRRPGDPVTRAAEYLRTSTSWTILDSKWESRRGGLDIVAADRDVFVACAVKTCSGTPAGPTEPARLRRLAVAWLNTRRLRYEQVRIDLITVTQDGPGGYTIQHVRGVG